MDTVEIIRKKKIWEKAQGMALSLKKTPDLMPGQRDMILKRSEWTATEALGYGEAVVAHVAPWRATPYLLWPHNPDHSYWSRTGIWSKYSCYAG